MKTITDYSRKMGPETEPLMLFYFDEVLRAIVADRIEFDPEEAHFAPEPSVGCRVESEQGGQFHLFYMQISKELCVYAEAGADSAVFREIFLTELPELASFRTWWFEDDDGAAP